MLIKKYIKLAELEEHMKAKSFAIKRELSTLTQEINELSIALANMPRIARDENGNEVASKEFDAAFAQYEEKREKFDHLTEVTEFMKIRLNELEVIEEESAGQVNKEKDEVEMTLNDMILLGLTDQELEKE